MSRKQQLLKRHRRNKRITLLIALIVLIALGVLVAWWLPLVLAVLAGSPMRPGLPITCSIRRKTITSTAFHRSHRSRSASERRTIASG
jgi:hypothetical protein